MKFKRGKVVGFKVGVYGGGTGNDRKHPASNACVFPTRAQARDAGTELLSRWLQPEGFVVIETTKELPNYVFKSGPRPRPMTGEEKAEMERTIAQHLHTPPTPETCSRRQHHAPGKICGVCLFEPSAIAESRTVTTTDEWGHEHIVGGHTTNKEEVKS